MAEQKNKLPISANMAMSAISGIASVPLVHPLDVVKTHLQVKN